MGMKWEYKVYTCRMMPDINANDKLNKLFGDKGWELVSVYKYEGDDNNSDWFERYIFKREINN